MRSRVATAVSVTLTLALVCGCSSTAFRRAGPLTAVSPEQFIAGVGAVLDNQGTVPDPTPTGPLSWVTEQRQDLLVLNNLDESAMLVVTGTALVVCGRGTQVRLSGGGLDGQRIRATPAGRPFRLVVRASAHTKARVHLETTHRACHPGGDVRDLRVGLLGLGAVVQSR